jgi:hypothetical protein
LLLVAVLTTACTGPQISWHLSMLEKITNTTDPTEKQVLTNEYESVVQAYETAKEDATAGHPCSQWFEAAMDAGFTPQQWAEPVSRIMYRESHCDPMADNSSSTARGLMQELAMWADDCGGTYEDLHNPQFNLDCAYHIWQVSGWGAWATY